MKGEPTMTDENKTPEHEEVHVERMEEPTEHPYYRPMVDIYEEDDALVLVTDMPGVTAAGVEVTCEDGVLSLNGRPELDLSPQAEVIYREYVPGDYHRCFRISEDIDVENISAKVARGVLTVTLPKAQRIRKHRIEVK
jgi:HSP20 family protein